MMIDLLRPLPEGPLMPCFDPSIGLCGPDMLLDKLTSRNQILEVDVPRCWVAAEPLPVNVGADVRRRVPAEMLRYPFMWLPAHLAAPIATDQSIEPVPAWQARVWMTLSGAGFVTRDGWMDVWQQATGGPWTGDESRMVSWLAGGTDRMLDQIPEMLLDAAASADPDIPEMADMLTVVPLTSGLPPLQTLAVGLCVSVLAGLADEADDDLIGLLPWMTAQLPGQAIETTWHQTAQHISTLTSLDAKRTVYRETARSVFPRLIDQATEALTLITAALGDRASLVDGDV